MKKWRFLAGNGHQERFFALQATQEVDPLRIARTLERLRLGRVAHFGVDARDLIADHLAALDSGVPHDDGELVAADPADPVVRAEGARQFFGEPAKDPVARVVTVGVVDFLEPVEVDKNQGVPPLRGAVEIPVEETPTICLEAERDELGIACGLQDRVIQMYDGVVYMDFERSLVESTGHGRYERLFPGREGFDPSGLGLYIAYDPRRAEESGKAHRKVKKLFEQKNSDIVAAMGEFADIARLGREALLAGDIRELDRLVNANFDLRDRIFNVAEENKRMVMAARSAGASAKFAGSGGAIVGLCPDDETYTRLEKVLAGIGCRTLRPAIATGKDDTAPADDTGWRNS